MKSISSLQPITGLWSCLSSIASWAWVQSCFGTQIFDFSKKKLEVITVLWFRSTLLKVEITPESLIVWKNGCYRVKQWVRKWLAISLFFCIYRFLWQFLWLIAIFCPQKLVLSPITLEWSTFLENRAYYINQHLSRTKIRPSA